MLEGVLGRPIRTVQVIDPDIPGEKVRDKEIVLDVRAVLDDGSRAIIEMQVRLSPALTGPDRQVGVLPRSGLRGPAPSRAGL